MDFTSLYAIWYSTVLQLVRDKVFLPFTVFALCFIGASVMVGDWAASDFTKVMMELGAFGFHIAGGFLALFWSVRLIGDSKADGVMELQLSSPISRTVWVFGKFLGLACVLLALGAIMIAGWQASRFIGGFGLMTIQELVIFGLIIWLWIVLAGLGFFFCSFAGANIALFQGIAMWVLGIFSPIAVSALNEKVPLVIQWVVRKIAFLWDLQRFIQTDLVYHFQPIDWTSVLWRVAYGLGVLFVLIPTAGYIFSTKDIAG